MFHFLIDLENTRSCGLQGAEYLSPEDSVTLFYSQTCVKVEKGKLQQIENAGSAMSICRLKNTGKNALDFYIASKAGELFGSGFEGTVAIVSRDKGFRAVRDYWKCRSLTLKNVIIQSDIEQCIMVSGEDSERRRLIQEKLQEVNLELRYRQYEERLRVRRELEKCFADSEYGEMLKEIIEIAESGKDRRTLYLNTVRKFGKKRGLDIYGKLRNAVQPRLPRQS